jgi:hypothetical protein
MLLLTAATPIISWLILNIAAGVLLTLPARKRLLAIPAILIPTAISFNTSRCLDLVVGLPELWGLVTLITFVHFTSLLFIKRWTFVRSKTCDRCHARLKNPWPFYPRWVCLYKAVSSPRFVGIPYKHIVLPNQLSPPKTTSIHRNFTMGRACWLPVKIVLLCAFNSMVVSKVLGVVSVDDFVLARALLLRIFYTNDGHLLIDLGTTRMMIIRVWITVTSICTPILALDSLHAGLAIFCIYVLRIDTPEDWPDLFGSPWEAYSLSQFWSRYVAPLRSIPQANPRKDSGIGYTSAVTAISLA